MFRGEPSIRGFITSPPSLKQKRPGRSGGCSHIAFNGNFITSGIRTQFSDTVRWTLLNSRATACSWQRFHKVSVLPQRFAKRRNRTFLVWNEVMICMISPINAGLVRGGHTTRVLHDQHGSASLLCSALYAKCPYSSVLYMQSVVLCAFYMQSVISLSAL